MIEVLSPVGRAETLTAAVRSGADAVYLGLGDFNARRNAENFSQEQLKEAVEYCHSRGVKVYVALNTLVYSGEIERALEVAKSAARCSADALICADLGLASLIKKAIPLLPLHASTQMTVHTKAALPLLKELGFSRVVPSREMSREELRAFCKTAKELGIEVEVFVHGALCMSMSGNCLMSAYLGGRSGNRGLCAGTCRLPFSATDRSDEYALSLKDSCLINYIEDLKNMGVDSLKIEGRMKPPEYVAAATSAFREMVDSGSVTKEKLQILEGVFSRSGFTEGYFTGERKNMFGVRTDENVTLSKETKNKTHEYYRNETNRVGVIMEFKAEKDRPISLKITDGKKDATVFGDIPEMAINRAIDEKYISAQLSKLGSTPYFLKKAEIIVGDSLSVRASSLNDLRRRATEKLTQLRGVVAPHPIEEISLERFSRKEGKKPKILLRVRSAQMLEGLDLSHVSAVILPSEEIEDCEIPKPIIADIPSGMSDKKLIDRCIKTAKAKNLYVYCRNLSAVEIAKQENIPFIVGTELNVINQFSSEVFRKLGAKAQLVSTEAKLSEIGGFSENLPLGAVIYGKTRLMLTRNCPIKESVGCKNCEHKITDRKAVEFVVFCRGGYAEIFNSRPIYLLDRISEFSRFDFLCLDFVDEKPQEIKKLLEEMSGKKNHALPSEYTRGLYYTGVK